MYAGGVPFACFPHGLDMRKRCMLCNLVQKRILSLEGRVLDPNSTAPNPLPPVIFGLEKFRIGWGRARHGRSCREFLQSLHVSTVAVREAEIGKRSAALEYAEVRLAHPFVHGSPDPWGRALTRDGPVANDPLGQYRRRLV